MRPAPALLRALLISLAAHLLLLLGIVILPELRLRPELPGSAMSAVLVKAHKTAAVVASSASAAPRPQPQPEPMRASGMTTPSPISVPAPAPTETALPRILPTGAAAKEAPPSSTALADDRSVASAKGDADGPEAADALRQYKIALSSQARRFKRYPTLARERGWQGTVGIEIRIYPQSAVPEATLASASGHAVLDEQALDMLRQAVSRATPPDALRRRGAQFVLPVVFSLDE
jgi:protein TonB